MPAGRPTKYRAEYCEAVVEHCKDGASLTSFAAEIGVCRDTVSEWITKHPDFSVAAARAKAACAAWWEKIARKNAESGEGSATLVVFGLKNMGAADWSDTHKLEHTGKDGGPLEYAAASDLEIEELFGPQPELTVEPR